MMQKKEVKMLGKKGISIWVSWVLLVAFVVVLSAFMYTWITGYAESTGERIKKIAYDTEECNLVGLGVDGVCQDLHKTHSFTFNVTNREDAIINQLIFRSYDIYNVPSVRSTNVTIRPGRSKSVEILGESVAARIEVIPVLFREDFMIVCREQKATETRISIC